MNLDRLARGWGGLSRYEPYIFFLQTPYFAKLTSEPHSSGSEYHINCSEPHISGSEPHTTSSEHHKMALVTCVFFFNTFHCL